MSQSTYVQRAEEAEAEAERAASPDEREALMRIARLWRELAEGVASIWPPET